MCLTHPRCSYWRSCVWGKIGCDQGGVLWAKMSSGSGGERVYRPQYGACTSPKIVLGAWHRFFETEKAVAAIPTQVTARAATDLAPGHLAAAVIFRSVGVEWDFGAVEHQQQLGLLRMPACEQTVDRDEPSLKREDAIEPRSQTCSALGRRR